MTVPLESKTAVLPRFPRCCATTRSATSPSLLLAAALGGVFAFVVGLPLMRLSGLAAGIATFAVLEITHNVLISGQDRARRDHARRSCRRRPDALQATVGALVVIAVAFVYQRTRRGRLLRASREDPAAARASA